MESESPALSMPSSGEGMRKAGRGCSPKQIAQLEALHVANTGRKRTPKEAAQLAELHALPRSPKQIARAKVILATTWKQPRSPKQIAHTKMLHALPRSPKQMVALKATQAMNAGKKRKSYPLSPKQLANLKAMHAANVGRRQTPEWIEKRGITRLGDKSPRWRGGISREPYAWTFNAELKEEVRRRDGYKCQLCGVPQAECDRKLPVHHIDYDKKNSDPVNLTALCNVCNAKVNANRTYWTAFFQEKALSRARQGLLF